LKSSSVPVGSSIFRSIFLTFAPAGPRLQYSISILTASSSPSNTASTLSSGVLRIHPFTPWRSALCFVSDLKKTPWTLPVMRTWTLIIVCLSCELR
jgi:hypothetical protein